MKKGIFIPVLTIIIVSNVTPIVYFFKDDYAFSNHNGEFYVSELGGKGRSFTSIKDGFDFYSKEHPLEKDKTLYRTFTLKPWRFWEWGQWIAHFDRFTLPYITENQIIENRKKEGLPVLK